MEKRGMKQTFCCLIALVFLMPIVGVRPAVAAKDDCRPDGEAHALHCIWDQQDFRGRLKAFGPAEPAAFAGQCVNFSIKSAANNGKSGFTTLYLYERADCAGDSAIKLNAGESVASATAQSARFGPKGAYR